MVHYVHVEKGQVFESITSLPLPLPLPMPLPIFLFILYIYFLSYFSFGNCSWFNQFQIKIFELESTFSKYSITPHICICFTINYNVFKSRVTSARQIEYIYILSLKPYREEDPPHPSPFLRSLPSSSQFSNNSLRCGMGKTEKGKRKKEKGKRADLPFSHTLAFRKSLFIFIWFNILSLLT